MAGLAVLKQMVDAGCELPTVVITAFADEGVRERARELGVTAVLDKPIDPDELHHSLQAAIAAAGHFRLGAVDPREGQGTR